MTHAKTLILYEVFNFLTLLLTHSMISFLLLIQITVFKAFAFAEFCHELISELHICAFIDFTIFEFQKRSAVCFCDITAVLCMNEVSHFLHTVELYALVIESGMTEEHVVIHFCHAHPQSIPKSSSGE